MTDFQENVQNPKFWHLIPLNPGIKIFFKIPTMSFFYVIDPLLHAKFYKDLIMASYRTMMDRRTDEADYIEPAFS